MTSSDSDPPAKALSGSPPIGRARSDFPEPAGTPIQPPAAKDSVGKVEVFPRFREGLADLDGFSHVYLLYHCHKSGPCKLKVRPFLDNQERGVFATRAPSRPNSIGLSVVEILKVTPDGLEVRGLDLVDKTPILDIKPYVPEFDVQKDVRVGWLEKGKKSLSKARDDGRFTPGGTAGGMEFVLGPENAGKDTDLSLFSQENRAAVAKFHNSLPGFKPTPLVSLKSLARHLDLSGVWIKDESARMDLNAFKILGASWAVANALGKKLGMDLPPGFSDFSAPDIKNRLSDITLVTATDGNHGRAVAWMAARLGCSCMVYMPEGTAPSRLQFIRDLGADARIIDGSFDDAVRLAMKMADKKGWLPVLDTAAGGDPDIPRHVMQGYSAMAAEALDQLGDQIPTHVFAQCGVGSFAAAVLGTLKQHLGENMPKFLVAEPEAAACYLKSMAINDGAPHAVTGKMDTIMAGLACGEPNPLAWEILSQNASAFAACPDLVAKTGMRVLANPLPGDLPVVSGESGAVTLGLVFALYTKKELAPLKDGLGLDENSRILLFSTEGDTDPDMYRRIMWNLA